MLTSIIDRLTSLASRHFIIGAFVPVLVFGFLNGVLLYLEFDWFHDWAAPQLIASRAFDAAAVGFGLAVVAYVVRSLNGFLREVLEGRHLRPDSWLRRTLSGAQLKRLRQLRAHYFNARNASAEVTRSKKQWADELTDAAVKGIALRDASGKPVQDASGKPVPNPVHTYDGKNGKAASALAGLRQARTQAVELPVAGLAGAVTELSAELEANNIQIPNTSTGINVLTEDHRDLLTLIDYAEDRWRARELALANQLQWRFAVSDVVPTAFGNVAAATESYGVTRYGINLPTVWSRMQAVLQKDEAFLGMLRDAKSQLDFLVSSFWLTVLTTAVWAVVLPLSGSSILRFVFIMIAGPLVARLCYIAAVENYVAFGEIVRSAVDLHRLRLLEALHLRQPASLRDERRIWEALRRVTAFGQEWVDIGYEHPESKT